MGCSKQPENIEKHTPTDHKAHKSRQKKQPKKEKNSFSRENLIGSWELHYIRSEKVQGRDMKMIFEGRSTYLTNGKSNGFGTLTFSSNHFPGDYKYILTSVDTWSLDNGLISETNSKVNITPVPSRGQVRQVAKMFATMLKGMEGVSTESKVLNYDGRNLVVKSDGEVMTYKRVIH